MDTTKFLEAVLGDSGYYCLFGFSAETKRKVQKFYLSIDQLVDAAYAMDRNEHDAYFALGTFAEAGTRTAANVAQLRAFWLDLDCGPTKEFPDKATAIAALRLFCKTAGLRKPYMVDSGRGVHVYWPLTAPVTVAEWRPVADALKRTCAALGLPSDTSCTSDAARVLRIPQTHNYKDNPPNPVKLLQGGAVEPYTMQEFSAVLGATTPVAPTVAVPATLFNMPKMSVADDPVMQRLMRNKTSRFKPILVKSMGGTGCAQVRYAFENQSEISEPLWRAMLSIAAFCEDAEKGAKAMSAQHPDYSWEDTERKMRGAVGPHRCTTIDGINPGLCADCPLFGKISSPIQLGTEIELADPEDAVVVVAEKAHGGEVKEYTIPAYPSPYSRGRHGGVYVRETDEAGDPIDVPVYVNDLYFVRRIRDAEYGECIVGRVHLPMDGVREFVIPLVAATSKEELRKVLAEYGVVVMGKGWERLMSYTSSWVDTLQATTVADDARRQFGWTDDEMTSFVIGSREIKADSIGYNPPSAATAFMFPAFEPAGTLEGWVEDADFYNRPGLEPYQHMLCLSFGAMLMRLTPVHAAIYDMYSDGSGRGKTTTQKVALSIYGNPTVLMVGVSDTVNMRMNRLELMKDIAVQFDEFTEFPAEHTPELLYTATGGRQKGRMSSGSNAERLRGEPWYLSIGVSTNTSMMSKVHSVKSAPRAEAQRVLEYHVQPFNFASKNETDVLAARVGDNRGHAAVPFIQYIINNRDTVRELIESVQRKIDKATGLDATNRLWSVQATVSIVSLIIGRELGLLNYDVAKLFDFTVTLINGNKRSDTESTTSIETMVNDYVNDNYGSILWIKSTEDLRGDNGNGLDSLAVPEHQPRMKFVARYETDTKKLFLVPKPLRAWCARNRLNYDSFVQQATTKLAGRKAKVRLSKGTKLNLPATDVLVLDCSVMDMLGVPDGHSEG